MASNGLRQLVWLAGASALALNACGSDSQGADPDHTGGATTGGAATGGASSGGTTTGGTATGGRATGGAAQATGGAGPGGSASGGKAMTEAGAGGSENGGSASGGTAMAGAGTGGSTSGGVGTAGSENGGSGNGGSGNDPFLCDTSENVLVSDVGQSDDATIAFELFRCMPPICAGGCPVLDVYFSLTYEDRFDEATSDDIEYTQTHHNWSDSLVGTLSDRRLRWRTQVAEGEDFGLEHFVAVEDLDGAPILAETKVPAL